MSVNKCQKKSNKLHITQSSYLRTCIHTLLLCKHYFALDFRVDWSLFIWAFLKWQLSLYSWHSALFSHPQTNHPLLNNHGLAGQTFAAQKIHRTLLLWFSLIFPRRVGVDMSEVQQAARVLEAEAKFTSLRCHRCRSASAVVMETLAMREGLCPKARHSSWELVLGKQVHRNSSCHFPEKIAHRNLSYVMTQS